MIRALALLLLLLAGCAHLPPARLQEAVRVAQEARSSELSCTGADHCAIASPLRAQAPASPRHLVGLLDGGQEALLARLHLIRSARTSIVLQSFIFAEDHSGRLVLHELLQAARRGVHVRVLLDQLYGLPNPGLQAALAGEHRNFELRLYNPTWREARTQPLQYAAGIFFSFRRFNQRMHTKLLLVDGEAAITGGRNVQDRYFDWDPDFNYRDRDILVIGPTAALMGANFEAFWRNPRTVPAEHLNDVAERLLANRDDLDAPLAGLPEQDARTQAMAALAGDGEAALARLRAHLFEVGEVRFVADLPEKHDTGEDTDADASQQMRELVAGVQDELVLQTPYLVFSRPARRLFRELQERERKPLVRVSTNSLAATDAFPVYAMSHKYKRLYLRELGFRIHEFKPFPVDAPIDVIATGALDRPRSRGPVFGSGGSVGPVPLKRAGVRVGLHAKSMVIDGRVGVVGSHNFDPRSDHLNTESLVVVPDAAFAAELRRRIENDMSALNAWTIAPRPKPPLLSGLNYSLGKISEALPIFDIWPFPYATSYELREGCAPLPINHPDFHRCYQQVGDFPEVDLPLKSIYTRIITAFGAGLVPIL